MKTTNKNSFNDFVINRQGVVTNTRRKKKIKITQQAGGYKIFRWWDGKRGYTILVHRMLVNKYIPNPENKPEVNHINGDKTDNRLSNLEWVTHKENMHHTLKIGLWDDITNLKIPPDKKMKLRQLYLKGKTHKELSVKFGISEKHSSRINSSFK